MTCTQDIMQARKAWLTLQARFCLRGFSLDRLAGGMGFRVACGRCWSIDLPDLKNLIAFAERAGVDVE